MNRISARYQSRGSSEKMVLQDFDSLRQALNVASADQRPLVVMTKENAELKKRLQKLASDKELVGKFHFDQLNTKTDSNWKKVIQGEKNGSGLLIVHSDQFGLKGKVLAQLTAESNLTEIKNALSKAHKKFASNEKRKDHGKHVGAGLRKGIYFENKIPYGEDRDGDGKVDRTNRRRGR